MLEDLSMCDIDDTQIIRIGKDEKLTELVRNKYAVDYAKERWIKSIIEKSTLKIVEVLNKLSVSEDDFYAYFDALSKNKGTNASSKEKDKYTKIIDEFECKYPNVGQRVHRNLTTNKRYKTSKNLHIIVCS